MASATEEGEGRPWRLDPQFSLQQSFSARATPAATSKEFGDLQKLDAAFGVPMESYPLELNNPPIWDLAEKNWSARLKIFDPDSSFRRFAVKNPNTLRVFQDRDQRTVPDFEIRGGAPAILPLPRTTPPNNRPLEGIRIALDPGHIGSQLWDKRDGKYVQDKRGRYLSEGTMALQVALLLEPELRALGADVLITHRDFRPVFQGGSYERFPLENYALEEFRSSRLSDWFLKLLTTFSPVDMIPAARAHPNIQRIFRNGIWARYRYFFQRADLQARANVINAFKPDLTVIIHFDIDGAPGVGHGLNPQNYNSTKAFIPGHFQFSEVSTRAQRAQLARGLVQGSLWEKSVRLSRTVTHSISRKLGIPLDKGNPDFVTQIEPGVFARNLGLLRSLEGPGPVTFLECLFYNGPTEFEKMVAQDFAITIDGIKTYYSHRLKSLVEAIRDGLISYQP